MENRGHFNSFEAWVAEAVGNTAFVERLETDLGRILKPRKLGRKPKHAGPEPK